MRQFFVNNFDTTLADSISDSLPRIPLTTTAGMTNENDGEFYGIDHYRLTITANGLFEIVRVIWVYTDNSVEVVRGQEGTTARAWTTGARVFAGVTDGTLSAMLRNANDEPVRVVSDGEDGNLSIGQGATASGLNAIAFGQGASADHNGCTSLGNAASSAAQNGTALGHSATNEAQGALAVGQGAYTTTTRTAHIAALQAIQASYGGFNDAEGELYWRQSSSEVVCATSEIDLTATGTITITMPTGAFDTFVRFYPDDVSLIITAADTVTVQPTVRLGITGEEAKYLAAVQTTGLDAAHKRQVFDLLTPDGAATLRAEVTVAATATELKGRFVWRGIAMVHE